MNFYIILYISLVYHEDISFKNRALIRSNLHCLLSKLELAINRFVYVVDTN